MGHSGYAVTAIISSNRNIFEHRPDCQNLVRRAGEHRFLRFLKYNPIICVYLTACVSHVRRVRENLWSIQSNHDR